MSAITCSTCGTAAPEDSRFCPSCGSEFDLRPDERRVVTVLFADLVGFTGFSEHRDPEEVKALVDRGFERLVGDIAEFGGRVDKIVGDAIVALFGAPVAHEDDAERAVRAALRMQETIASYSDELSADIRLRIGINTGEVLTGAMRSGGDYTAMGDVVNTASRLQTSADPGSVVVGTRTRDVTFDAIAYEQLGPMEVRGRETPVDPWLALGVLGAPGRRPRQLRTAMVGRDGEMRMLGEVVALAAEHHRSALVLITGDAGVGKTRLADEVTAHAEDELSALVLNAQCVPYGEANVWYPLGSVVRAATGLADGATAAEARQIVGSVVADLATSVPSGPVETDRKLNSLLHLMGYVDLRSELEPQMVRDEARRALVWFAESLALKRPVVIRLADFHWAHDRVVELVDAMVQELSQSPVIVIATARPGLDERWSPMLGRPHLVHLGLDPLSEAATRRLLDQLSDGVNEARAASLVARSGGNPLFLEELTSLVGRADTGAPPAFPETLRGLIAARLDALTAAEQEVIEHASVVGRQGPLLALEEMATHGRSATDVQNVVAGLVEIGLLTSDGPRLWAFRSDVVREVAYARITKSQRAQLHAAIARYIEDNMVGEVAEDNLVASMARHYRAAALLSEEIGSGGLPTDLRERAISWQGEAASRADEAEMFRLSGRLFHEALDLVGETPSADRLTFLLGRARARTGLLEIPRARADVERALGVADALDDVPGRGRAFLAQAELERTAGQLEESDAAVEGALRIGQDHDDLPMVAEALRLGGMNALYRGDYDAAEATIDRALETFSELGDTRGEAWAYQNLAWTSYMTGRVAEAEVRLGRSADTFNRLGDRSGLAWTNGLLAFTRLNQGRFEEAEALAEGVIESAREHGNRFGEGMSLLLTAMVRLWTGRIGLAIERAHEARRLFAASGDPIGEAQSAAVLGRALLSAGRTSEAFELLERAVSTLDQPANLSRRELGATVFVAAAVMVGDPRRGLAALDQIQGDSRAAVIGTEDRVVARALLSLQLGDVDDALETIGQLFDDPPAGFAPTGNSMQSRALILAAAGDDEGAQRAANAVFDMAQATYIDRTFAGIALIMSAARSKSAAVHELTKAFDELRATTDATDDVMMAAIVRLAETHVLDMIGDPAATASRRQTEQRLVELGIDAAGWSVVFEAICAAGDGS